MTLERLTRRLADQTPGRHRADPHRADPGSAEPGARQLADDPQAGSAAPADDRTVGDARPPVDGSPFGGSPTLAERPADALRGGSPGGGPLRGGPLRGGPLQGGPLRGGPLRGGPLRRRAGVAAQAAEALARAAAEAAFAIEHDETPLAVRARACRRTLGADRDAALAEALALVAVAAQRALGLRPHLAQLTAAAIVLQDGVAELPTGEGHLLSLVVAASVRALAGEPVHLVLRHDALVAEGFGRYRALFDALDLETGLVTTGLAPAQRVVAHRAEVVFTSAAALLQDRGGRAGRQAVPSFAGLRSAFLHEADRLLVDGARFRPSSSPLTLRELFRRYWRLGGVTATAREVSDELAEVYGLAVVLVGSIYPAFERVLGWRILPDRASQQRWLLDRIAALREARRPVLILAAHRDECHGLAALLMDRGIEPVRCDLAMTDPARVALAAQEAGKARAVSLHVVIDPLPLTVVPEPLARAAGGLALIVTALGPTRRHDRHNAGRIGHQGEPGTIEAILDARRPIVMAGWAQSVPGLARLAALGAPQHLLAMAIVARRRQLDARMRRLRTLGLDEAGPQGEADAAVRNASLLPSTPEVPPAPVPDTWFQTPLPPDSR